MKKTVFLLGLLAAAVPETGSAKLVLDMPPIVAAAAQETCTVTADCSSGICCGGRCYTGTGVCCSGGTVYCPWLAVCTSCANPCDNSCNNPVLNDTGITAKAGAGLQDADYGRDKTANSSGDGLAGFSFTKSGNCVIDNVTNLIWSPDQGITSWSGIDTKISTANTNKLCGLANWRKPTLRELLSIVAYDGASYTAGKMVDTAFFADTQVGSATAVPVWYWTGTVANPSVPPVQWGVSFQPIGKSGTTTIYTASVSNTLSTSALDSHPVRLVSGTQVASSFTPVGDGSSVRDNTTGLTWQRCFAGQTYANGSCSGTAAKTWNQALALDDGTWRVPNLKELQSIAGVPAYFSAAGLVWSASPYAGNTNNIWIVNFPDGQFYNSLGQNQGSVYVRLVKGP